MTYKASNGNHSFYKNSTDLISAQNYFTNVGLSVEYIVTEASTEEQIPELTTEQRVKNDLEFGNHLYFTFLVDNESTPATPQEVGAMFVKFGDAKNALLAGAIVQARYEVSILTTDSLFTQSRKDKYLAMMDAYLSQYL